MAEPSRAPEPLKPCPFCGELPTPYSWDSPLTGPNSEIVHCATVGCPASTHEKMERSNRAAWNRRSATPASPAAPKQWENIRAVAWRIYEMAKAQGDTDQRAVERVAEAVGSLQMPLPLTAGRVMAALMACGTKDVKRLTEVLNANVLALSPSSPREPSERAVEALIRHQIGSDHWDQRLENPDYRDNVSLLRARARRELEIAYHIDFPPSGGTT